MFHYTESANTDINNLNGYCGKTIRLYAWLIVYLVDNELHFATEYSFMR